MASVETFWILAYRAPAAAWPGRSLCGGTEALARERRRTIWSRHGRLQLRDLRESILRDEGLRLIGIVNGPLYGHLNWPLLVDALRPLLVDALRLFLVGALRLLMLRDEVFAAVVVRIAVVIALEWFSVAEPAAAVHIARLVDALHSAILSLRGQDYAVVVLGMLEIVLRRYRVAGGMGVPCERHILLRDVHRGAANLHIGAARLEIAAD